eukprot:403343769
MKIDSRAQGAIWAIMIYEFFGTALQVYAYNLTGDPDPITRGWAYFVGLIIAYQISGGCFNPAISLGAFIAQRNVKFLVTFIIQVVFQYLGAFFGLLITYLLAKNYENYNLGPEVQIGDSQYYYDDDGPKWARFIMPEILQTFTLVLVYLVLAFDKDMSKLDRSIKAIMLALTLIMCLVLGNGSGACLNPAQGIAQGIYVYAMKETESVGSGYYWIRLLWVYAVFPYVGGALAGGMYIIHSKIEEGEDLKKTGDNNKTKSSLILPLFYEFCGTAFAIYVYNLSNHIELFRGLAYFISYLIAVRVSGAHFNPATTLAVYVVEQKYKQNLFYLGVVCLCQFLGGLAGLLITYLLIKGEGALKLYPSNTDLYFYNDTVFFGRVCMQEFLWTFTFTLIFLIIQFEPSLRKVNKIAKGLAISHSLGACLSFTLNSGSCFNPVLGLVQTFYMNGMLGTNVHWDCIWVYTLMPLIGAYCSALFYGFHIQAQSQNVDNEHNDSKQKLISKQ